MFSCNKLILVKIKQLNQLININFIKPILYNIFYNHPKIPSHRTH